MKEEGKDDYVDLVIEQIKQGRNMIPFNFWCSRYVKVLDKKADRKFRLFGVSYYLFGKKLYSCEGEYLGCITGWKKNFKFVYNHLQDLL